MELMDPSHEQQLDGSEPAARISSLNGAVVGLISNGKENTLPFFDRVELILRTEFRKLFAESKKITAPRPNLS